MADEPRKGILDQLIEEAMAKGRESATQDDFAITLSTTDGDGRTHSVEGIPVSKAGKFLYDTFGIGEPPAPAEGGKEGEGKEGGGKPPTLKSYFGGKAS
jgi:hypothetical protein